MGARGWQLLRQTLAESLLLAFTGALAGLAFAYGSIELLLQLTPESVAAGLEARIDVYVLLFTATAAVLSGLLFGVAPAWQVGRLNPYEVLKSAGRSATGGRARQHLRSGLVVGEAALALVLLVGAGLFLQSFSRLQQENPGFETRGVVTAMLSLPPTQYAEQERRISFNRALLERLRVLPGVTSAGLGLPLPFSGNSSSASFRVEGREGGPGDPGPHGNVRWVSPGYFEAMGIPLRGGRTFSDADRADTEPVVVIDENLARQYWPDQDPIGKHMKRGGDSTPWSTVVGVVGHIKHSDLATEEEKGTYYYSVFQTPPPYTGIVLRTQLDPASLAGAIRQAVLAVDPNQPVDQLRTMERMIGDSLAAQRLAARLLGFFATAALFLAALGLYGVISYSVAQRTQEIGVRMALGAQRGSVLSLVVAQGLKLAGIGVGLGLVLAVASSLALESQLFGVTALDPLTFGAMAAVLLGAAFLASYLPARRATKVNPLQALRYE
jgi:putative ABC transport system permease protein